MVRIQTGVIVSGYGGYLTALHGVVGCETILVTRSADEDAKPVKVEVEKLDFGNDIALLTSSGSLASVGRTPAKAVEPVEPLTIIGFPGATNSPWYLTVNVTPVETSKRWFDADPDAVSMIQGREFESGATSPDLNREMITVQGPVRPGHSGAPVFNSRGEVVGLAEGGLSNEAASFVVPIWSIKLTGRKSVETQYDTLAKVPLGSLYSAEGRSSEKKLKRLGITITRPNLLKFAQEGGAQEVSLLSVFMEPDSHDPDGPTPLMLAAKGAHYDVLRTLLAAGADPSFQLAGGGVPEAAVAGGSLAVVAAVLGFEPGKPAPKAEQGIVIANRALKAATPLL
ncbi:trypsin-like peptidase domain-containing protein [Rhizobium leguminosarum]|uniref:trypsin-like peptidase domain-containing protein n=1 Tax=Rhizobium leguminosarum TaxID=384 RepID=UPI001C97C292|nr:trypsin-like peptidase domain-containing protein [Rhizobium leguminosarum]MBY5420921.1 hypothetical protein [Rhizobium leguminosarum]